METTIVYWGNIRIMEKKMESTIMGYVRLFWGVEQWFRLWGFRGSGLGA